MPPTQGNARAFMGMVTSCRMAESPLRSLAPKFQCIPQYHCPHTAMRLVVDDLGGCQRIAHDPAAILLQNLAIAQAIGASGGDGGRLCCRTRQGWWTGVVCTAPGVDGGRVVTTPLDRLRGRGFGIRADCRSTFMLATCCGAALVLFGAYPLRGNGDIVNHKAAVGGSRSARESSTGAARRPSHAGQRC